MSPTRPRQLGTAGEHSESMPGTARAIARAVLRRLDCKIRIQRRPGQLQVGIHHPRIPAPPPTPVEVPRLFDDPVDALLYRYGGKPASFVCPIDQCVDANGLSLGDDGWHPFTATLHEYARGAISGYQGSSLQRYYQRWQPRNLQQALPGLPQDVPSMLQRLPSHALNLYPWSAKSVDDADEGMRDACRRDNIEHGRPGLTVREHGFKGHGPVSEQLMELELQRLGRVYDSLASTGYRRERGDVRVLALRRDGEYRFILSGGGLHRTAAMKVLGYASVPATFNILPVIHDRADIPRWPQVVDGVWDQRMAEAYVDAMFDFDARAWAQRLGLLQPDNQSMPHHAGTAAARRPAGPLDPTR